MESISKEINNDNELNLHSTTKLLGAAGFATDQYCVCDFPYTVMDIK